MSDDGERTVKSRGGMELVVRFVLVVLGLGTASPVMALVAPGTLESSYGVDNPEPMVLVLLQHRGVLQAALGAALVWAAFRPAVRVPVAITAIFTKGIGLALTVPNPVLRETLSATTVVFDSVAIVLLALIAVRQAVGGRRDGPGRR